MSVKGQTHNKRAREFALKEKRERKKAKKEDRRNGILPEADGTETDGTETDGLEADGTGEVSLLQAQPDAEAVWVQ